ncbi:unnamed protein product, partial [Phaeothamnion confervicola]
HYPEARRICVACGPGNNGGDGLVIARTWHNRHGKVNVFSLSPAEAYKGDALLNVKRLESAGVYLDHQSQLPHFREYDVIVDAIFGTGLTRPIEGQVATWIEAINASGRPVIAVDIASGIDASTGAVLGVAIRATHSVTFGLPKLGHYLQPGAENRGQLHIEEIGFPRQLLEEEGPDGNLFRRQDAARLVPDRKATAHKGTSGRILIWAGSPDYPGAATLCTRAALRAGAGLVFLVGTPRVNALALHHVPEVITLEVQSDKSEDEQVLEWLKGHKALAIGPGFGQNAARFNAVEKVLRASHRPPTLIDADALRVVPRLEHLGPNCVITPHHGEMARLLEVEVKDIEADRLGAALRAAARWQCTVVLKGAPSLIAEPDGRYWVNTSGHPVLAQGGTGDVLSGLITALLGQGCTPQEAALLGVYLHGRAGERVAQKSDRGILAHEIADELPATFREVQENPR